MGRKLTRGLIEANPLIDGFLIDRIAEGEAKTSKQLKDYAEYLGTMNFDLFISLWENPIYRELAKLAAFKYWVVGDPPPRVLVKHQVDYNLAVLRKIPIDTKPPENLTIKLKPENTNYADNLLAPLKPPIIVIAVGSGKHDVRWETESFISTAEYLIKKHNANIILIGGKKEKAPSDKIEKRINSSKVLNLAGKTSIEEDAAIIGKSQLYIGGNTGPAHIAAALKIPSLVIFNAKDSTVLRWGPWGTKHFVCIKKPDIAGSPSKKEVIEAAEKLLNHEGISGIEASRYYWKQKMFRTMIFCNSNTNETEEQAKKTVALLKDNGFYVWELDGRKCHTWNIIPIIIEMARKNINIIHHFGENSWLSKLLYRIARIHAVHLPIFSCDQGTYKTIDYLVDLYTEKFNQNE
ncbi:glycosyltransferase family 9 protein [Candidatus Margulisiibacteriota bacterium]